MALARIRLIEQLRYAPPGEYGKLLGWDRIPEVRTLRKKIKRLARREEVGQWSGALSRAWMEADPIPNYEEKTSSVRLHHLTNAMSDQAARFLADHLNESEVNILGPNCA